MKLLTEELKKQLPPLYSQQSEKDPLVICKFFHPLSFWTWYAIEGSPVDADGFYDTDKEKVDFLFFGWVHSDFSEMGYFSLHEMEQINGSYTFLVRPWKNGTNLLHSAHHN